MSTVIGNRPVRVVTAADEHMPIVVAGFEPLDLLEAIAMIVDQLADGRAEVENQYARVVRDDGNPVALRAIADTMSCGRGSSGAASGSINHSALQAPSATPTSTPSCASTCRACGSPTPRRASAARS